MTGSVWFTSHTLPNPFIASLAISAPMADSPSFTQPLCNTLLASIVQEIGPLSLGLERVRLSLGQVLHAAGQAIRSVYFPVDCIVSLESLLEDGSCAEFALAGREGLVGIGCFTGPRSTTYNATVLCEGHAWRVPADVMRSLFENNSRLRRLLLVYMQALMTDAAQKVVCIRRHTIDQQLCRTLLACLDRKPQEPLVLTQELIARTMGVRREAVTLAAQKLQALGLIAYTRGHITVLDRPGVGVHACECYKISFTAFNGLVQPPQV